MKVEKLEKSRAKITFDVTPDEFEHGLDHAFDHVQKDLTIKGFRKGKVPRNVYETKFGVESLYEDALNHIFGHKFDEALQIETIEIVSSPNVVDLDIKKIERGKPFTFAFEVALRPDVKLGQYKGLEVEKPNYEVTDDDVNHEVDALLASDSSLEPKKSGVIEKGDVAIFDFEGFKDNVPFEGGKAENHELEIGSNSFIPGFEEQMIGMKSGEEKDLHVTFPKNYHAADLAGAEVVFKVKLHEVKTKVTSELSDDWVKGLKREGVNTVEELKSDIRKKAETDKKLKEDNRITDTLVEKAGSNATVEIPVEMIQKEKEQMEKNVTEQAKQYGLELDMFLTLSGTNKEDFTKQLDSAANKRVLETLVLEEIAKNEKFSYEDSAYDEKYQEIAAMYNMDIEEVKKYLPRDVIKRELDFNRSISLLKEEAKYI